MSLGSRTPRSSEKRGWRKPQFPHVAKPKELQLNFKRRGCLQLLTFLFAFLLLLEPFQQISPALPPSTLPQTVHTCGAEHGHLQGGPAGLAAVHCEGLGYPGSDTSSQPWARALHLPRVHHILHRHPEGASCEEKDIYLPAREGLPDTEEPREGGLPCVCNAPGRPGQMFKCSGNW